MSVLSSLAERLAKGDQLVSAWCGIPEPGISGLLAQENFDSVVLDMQHGPIDLAAVMRCIPLINAAGKPAIARVPVGEFQNVSRLLDAGVSGVIAPMINTLDDAKRFAAYAKYPPMGERSWGAYGGMGASGLQPNDYLKQANGFSITLAMIETREAMAIVDDILAVPGIDGIFIGPADLSIALSGGKEVGPLGKPVTEAITHLTSRARAAGKYMSAFAHAAERANEFIRMGMNLVTVQSDTMFLRQGAQAALKIARG
jgi:4-hydroxy-2-oxoheptanedioate aldolase